MSGYVVLVQNPNTDGVMALSNDSDIQVFETKKEAIDCAARLPIVGAFGGRVFNLDNYEAFV